MALWWGLYVSGRDIARISSKSPSPASSIESCRHARPIAIRMWGLVLLNVSTGKETEFFSNLGSIQQVRHVFYLFDAYEYLIEVETETPQEMAEVLTNRIRHLPGVERTATYIQWSKAADAPVSRGEAFADARPVW